MFRWMTVLTMALDKPDTLSGFGGFLTVGGLGGWHNERGVALAWSRLMSTIQHVLSLSSLKNVSHFFILLFNTDMYISLCIAYCVLVSPKEGYLSRVGKVKPTLLTFPPISLPPSGLQVDPREPSDDRNNDTSG